MRGEVCSSNFWQTLEDIMIWPAQVLVVAGESNYRDALQKTLVASGTRVYCCATLLEAESFLSGQRVNAIFAEEKLPDGDFQSLRTEVEHFQLAVPIIALARNMDWDSYLANMASGAFDCLSLPASTLEIKRVLWSALNAFYTEPRPEHVASGAAESVLSTG
jgi:DNA-binding NtrC family response regulator